MTTAAARVREAYRRIVESDRPEVWISLCEEAMAIAAAEAVDARVAMGEHLPLAGLIAAVKDNIDVAGMPTTAGSVTYSYLPDSDATAVARLRAAGCVIIGKTNLDQFATGLVGTRSPFGPVRNAWDVDRISGGSSSGSAVAVALSLVDVSLGTDTAGSGRVPAALNGIVGVKLTRGRIPTTGVVPACRSYDCVTVFARDHRLAYQTAEILAGPDGIDPLERSTVEHAARLRMSPTTGLKIAVPTAEHLDGLADGWADAFQLAVAAARLTGATVTKVDITPLLAAARMLYESALVAERYAAVGDHISSHLDEIGKDLDPTVATIVLASAQHSAIDLLHARARIDALHTEADQLLGGFDALLTPTTTWHPTLEAVAADPIIANSRMGRYTNFANLLDMASTSIPWGTVGGLPFGIMLTGSAFSDKVLAEIADVLLTPPVEVFVVGAHLAGQPLNHELASAGATFIRRAVTVPTYALFALETTPPKPGLVTVSEGGASIEGEVWSLPADGYARFAAGLPTPMTLGLVKLADGSSPRGFLCEGFATEFAENISDYGGWLAWKQQSGLTNRGR